MSTHRLLTFIEAILVFLTFIEHIDIWIRIVSGIAAVIVAYYAAKAYKAKEKLNNIEAEIKSQELWRAVEENTRRAMEKKANEEQVKKEG